MTTGLWAAAGDPGCRMAQVSRWTGDGTPDFASVNLSEPGADELAEMLADGRPASGNGELVEAAVNLVAALGPAA